MENYFKISELCIDKSKDVPQHIADKILLYHILPMNKVRHELGLPINCSQNSGWRPKEWELSKGRSGKSKHCFLIDEKGAADWTAGDLKQLFKLILKHTEYTRIAVYPNAGFIHCDYSASKRQLFLSTNSSKWTSTTEDRILSAL